MILLASFIFNACIFFTGGECVYEDFDGTCTIEEEGQATFTGIVEDEDFTHTNAYTISNEEGPEPEVGTTAECTINVMTKGTCSPSFTIVVHN